MIQAINALRHTSAPTAVGSQPRVAGSPSTQSSEAGDGERVTAAPLQAAPMLDPIGPPLLPPVEGLQRSTNRTVPTAYQGAVSAGSAEWPVINAIMATRLPASQPAPAQLAAAPAPAPHLVARAYARYATS